LRTISTCHNSTSFVPYVFLFFQSLFHVGRPQKPSTTVQNPHKTSSVKINIYHKLYIMSKLIDSLGVLQDISFSGRMSGTVTTVAGNHSLDSDFILNVTDTANITLPDLTLAKYQGTSYTVVKQTANTVTILTQAADKILDTGAQVDSVALTGAAGEQIKLINNGTDWQRYDESSVGGGAGTVPDPPTTIVATAGDGSASISFTAPTEVGSSAITHYTATSSVGNFTGLNTSSPVTVTGLTGGVAYAFTVTAINSDGASVASATSNLVVPAIVNVTSGGTTLNLRLQNVDTINDVITIKNYTGSTLDISEFWLSSLGVTAQLSSLTIDSGSLTALTSGAEVKLSGFTLNDVAADLGLFSINSFADPVALVHFIQWGSGGNGVESVAVSKGIWPVGEFISGSSPYVYTGNGEDTGLGTIVEGALVRMTSVNPTTNQVVIKNFDTSSVDVSGYYLRALGAHTILSSLTLVSGSLTITAGSTVTIGDFSMNDTASDLGLYANGDSFINTANMVDFVQWGTPNNGVESVAVDKGIWTDEDYVIGLHPYTFSGIASDYGASYWAGFAPTSAVIDATGFFPEQNAVFGSSCSIDENYEIIGASKSGSGGGNISQMGSDLDEAISIIQFGVDIDGETAGDQSGYSVSTSDDGTRVAIGSPFHDGGGGSNSGHVRIFELTGGVWVQMGTDIDGTTTNEYAGFSVSLNGSGARVAVGVWQHDSLRGTVRVYDWSGSVWNQVGTDIDGEAINDLSGTSVDISSDGSRIAIGADSNDGNGSAAGHVRIYDWSGSVWVQIGDDIDGEATGDTSGQSVSLNSNGSRVAIGAGGNDGNGSNAGHVRIYELSGTTWAQLGADIDGVAGDGFGKSVSLSASGSRVVIGTNIPSSTGVVRIYELSGTTWGQLGVDIDGEEINDRFGYSVSMSHDGSRVVIGAYLNDGNGVDSGYVRVFDWSGSEWIRLYAMDINGDVGDYFGWSVSLSGDGTTVTIGAPNDGTGHVRVYDLTNEFQSFGKSVAMSRDGTYMVAARDGSADIYKWRGYWGLDHRVLGTVESVAISGDGAHVAISIGGRAVVYTRSKTPTGSSPWTHRWTDPNANATSVALSHNGDLLIMGNPGFTSNTGLVYPHVWNGGTYVAQTFVTGEATGDYFGHVVSVGHVGVSDSINAAVWAAGGYGNDTGGNFSGHVRVYRMSASSSIQLGTDIDGVIAGEQSGFSVSVSDSGHRVAIGSRYFNGTAGVVTGNVRVFQWAGTDWAQMGSDIEGEALGDESGTAVSMACDGYRLVIGAPKNDDGATEGGHLRIYDWSGTAWSQVGVDIPGLSANDGLGGAVSVSGDGLRVVAGASTHNSSRGLVKAYDLTGLNPTWMPVGQRVYGEYTEDASGDAVAISTNGMRIAIGAPYNDIVGIVGTNEGHVRVYELKNGFWEQMGADINGEGTNDNFGTSVSMNGNGTRVAIGAPMNDGGGVNSGHVRIFEWSGVSWDQMSSDIDGAAGDTSGISVSLSIDGMRVAIGHPLNDGIPSNSGMVSVYEWSGSVWNQMGSDIDGEAAEDNFGYSVSLNSDGTRFAASARQNDDSGNNAGHVRIFDWSGSAWVQVGQDIDGEAIDDLSGWSVSLSASGSRVAIGATQNDGGGSNSGHCRIFELSGTTWVQLGADIDGEAVGDRFGKSVSLSNDGNKVAIGTNENDGNGSAAGHVRVFEWNGSSWTQVSIDIDGCVGDQLGKSVSMSGDGSRILVGARVDDFFNQSSNAGSVSVYQLNTTPNWVQTGNDIDGEAAWDYSGQSVSISSDGFRVAVGTPQNDGNGSNAGHVRIYELSGTTWVQLGDDLDGEATLDESGYSVSLSGDGVRVAIGALYNDGTASNAGHVRIYEVSGTTWTQMGSDIDGEAGSNYFGASVSLSSDGSRVAVGAQLNDGNGGNAGHVRVFDWNGSAWVQAGLDIDGEAAGDRSGYSVSLSGDGLRVAVGAPFNDGTGAQAGHVRIHNWNGSAWVQIGVDIDGEAESDQFGWSVSLDNDGSRVAIGAYTNNGNGTNSGHVRVFEWSGSAWVQMGLDIDGMGSNDLLGSSVSLNSDGSRVVIGGRLSDATGLDSGHVRVFDWDGYSWNKVGFDIDGEASGDQSGYSVSMSGNGSRVVIGAYNNDANGSNSGHARVFELGSYGNDVLNAGAAYVYYKNTGTWGLQATLFADDKETDALYGAAVSVHGDWAVVGAPGYNTSAGAAYVYNRLGFSWSQTAKLEGDATLPLAAGDKFGCAVEIYESTMLIGACDQPSVVSGSGSVYVYELTGSTWNFVTRFTPDAFTNGHFGTSISVHSDRAAIGAPDTTGSGTGRVYVYDKLAGTWSRTTRFKTSDFATGDLIGNNVGVYNDTIMATAENKTNAQGAAYYFTYNGSVWSQTQKIVDVNPRDGDYFGRSIAIEGNIMCVGENRQDQTDPATAGQGRLLHVYTRPDTTSNWTLLTSVTPGEASFLDNGIGTRCAISNTTIVTTSPYDLTTATAKEIAYNINLS
jgi:hypothetical protein